MVDGSAEKDEIGAAFERLVDGDSSALSVVASEFPLAFGTIVIAVLGVLVRRRFGTPSSRSDLAEYAKGIHRAHEADGCPPIWVVETVLRVSAGEVSLLEESHSEDFYAATGLLVHSLLGDLNVTDESRASLLAEVNSIVERTLASLAGEDSHLGGKR